MERENLVKKAKTHLRFKFEEFVSHFNKYKAVNKSANIPTDYICKDGYKLGQKFGRDKSKQPANCKTKRNWFCLECKKSF